MNTYMVEVNAKFLVKIQLDGSCLAAEHFFLDNFKGVWGANAYDEKGMKTDCFRGAILTSEIVSLKEFEDLMREYDMVTDCVNEFARREKELAEQMAELQAEYDRIQKELNGAKKQENEAESRINWRAF